MCNSYLDVVALGGLAGIVLPLSKCLVTGITSLIGSSWEKEYPSLTVRACDGAKLGHPCRVLNFRKSCPLLWVDGNLLISGL